MAKRIPTQTGDVLILSTDQAFSVYVVGQVSTDGQQDFHDQKNAQYIGDLAAAKALAIRGGRIFIRNIDTDEWSEIPISADKGNA